MTPSTFEEEAIVSSLEMDSLAASDEVSDFIDESLYSRQLYVLGHEAMRKMINSNVLIIGLRGLGIEIAKNVVLAGVRSVTLLDPEVAKLSDLTAQFFLTEEDIGKRRDICSRPKLAELNEYVPVSVLENINSISELTPELVEKFQVVVVADAPTHLQLALNEMTHSKNIAFISAECRGLFASAFCDFGSNFIVSDATGEPPVIGLISGITKEVDGVVTCIEDARHGLEDGDYVTFREIKGMTELNSCTPLKVKVLDPVTFTIGDTSSFGDYETGGVFEQVKQPKSIAFASLKESLSKPEFVISDFAKIDRQVHLHVGFQALSMFESKKGRTPIPHDAADAAEVFAMAQEIATSSCMDVTVDDGLLKKLSFNAVGCIPAMAGFIGGMVAQEVLKACSGKFHPLFQHFYFDALECLPTDYDSLPPSEFAPVGSRYDDQIAIFGKSFMQKLHNLKCFVVGSGAIGCELMKLYSLMGVGSGPEGYIQLTDMDNIEKSNLNRQFLFRPWDVSKPKSKTAADAVTLINPDMKGKIHARVDRVGVETENIFGDDFYGPLDFVANALDNMDARKYVDRRCVFYGKPLLESGTLGTKGNTQVVIPHLTESYSSSQDPPEKTIPFCTLHNFPNSIEHTIQWAMDLFHGVYRTDLENANLYLSQPKEYRASLSQPGQGHKDRIEKVFRALVTEKASSFEDCVTWARLKFQELFSNNIRQLLFNFPRDAVTSSGTPFWSGPKRAPTPIDFDAENPLHLEFIIASANLRAENYGLKGSNDHALIKQILSTVVVPDFAPREGVKIQVTEGENASSTPSTPSTSQEEIEEILHALPDPSAMVGYKLHPIEFEKDDDTNFHVDFVAATANLRAINYEITPAERHKIKQIAGKIIPAIATTTAVVAGLITLELYKVCDAESNSQHHQGNPAKRLERYKNSFVNLALPFCAFSEPIAAPKLTYNNVEWTLWDRFEVDGNPTLAEFIEYFKREHSLIITMLSYGSSMLFGFIRSKEVIEERMKMPMTALVESVSKKPLPSYGKSMVLEILAEDLEGNDVEVPYVLLKYHK